MENFGHPHIYIFTNTGALIRCLLSVEICFLYVKVVCLLRWNSRFVSQNIRSGRPSSFAFPGSRDAATFYPWMSETFYTILSSLLLILILLISSSNYPNILIFSCFVSCYSLLKILVFMVLSLCCTYSGWLISFVFARLDR